VPIVVAKLSRMSRLWTLMDVDALPWPHHLFRCRWAHRFGEATKDAATEAECRSNVRAVASALSEEEVAACEYHSAQWNVAADIGVELVRNGDTSWTAISRAQQAHGLNDATAQALLSLFADPIFLSGESLGNGQHRVCALKLSRARRCPVER
jgi:hypothetical protein